MQLKFAIIFLLFILLGNIFASQAGTFKPFIRSRYSIRWRKTTEMPNVWDSSTTAVAKEAVQQISTKPIEVSDSPTDDSVQLSTIKPVLKTSTHSPDYDYYNNEVEDGEHKN